MTYLLIERDKLPVNEEENEGSTSLLMTELRLSQLSSTSSCLLDIVLMVVVSVSLLSSVEAVLEPEAAACMLRTVVVAASAATVVGRNVSSSGFKDDITVDEDVELVTSSVSRWRKMLKKRA